MDIALGQTVSVEVVKAPRSLAARKTLLRLFRKDAGVARSLRRLKTKRPSWQTWRRGGRFWHHQMRSKPPIAITPGAKYTLHTTVNVVRDLQSVGSCVKITAQ